MRISPNVNIFFVTRALDFDDFVFGTGRLLDLFSHRHRHIGPSMDRRSIG